MGLINYLKSIKFYFIYFVVMLFFSILIFKDSVYWIGGDTIPSFRLLDFITARNQMWGISGYDSSFSYISWVFHALVINFLKLIVGRYLDIVVFALWLFVASIGYFKMFGTTAKDKLLQFLLTGTILSSPYMWLVVNRNVFFLLVLFAGLPWIIVTSKNVLEYESFVSRIAKFRAWLFFFITMLFVSPGLMNPGYAVPAFLFIVSFIFIFIDWKKYILRWYGIIAIVLLLALPNIIGQVNLLMHSQALKDDYWNNIVLTQIPLNKQITSNTVNNVIRGYNSDTLTSYGQLNGEDYYPWWFAAHRDSLFSLILYIPIVLMVLGIIFSDKKYKFIIVYWLYWLMFYIFMMKSSSGPGGKVFYNFMMDHGWFKMFRSPHQKFGVEYFLVLTVIIGSAYNSLNSAMIRNFFKCLILVYVAVFGMYPLLTGKYIPLLQKINDIPSEYYDLQKYLQNENRENKIYDLGILLPVNESTWDSNNWGSDGFYEGYHILHWMNTSVSFLNRNGLSFNSKNQIGYDALIKISNFDSSSIKILKDQGYDIIVYDKSSDRESRFGIKENHQENIEWLDSLTSVDSDYINKMPILSKIWEEGYLIMYKIN